MGIKYTGDSQKIVLDGHKMVYHLDRVRDWLNGKRIAPITMDVALTRRCNFKCKYCYSQLQYNEGKELNKEVLFNFAEDIAEIGVKGVSLISDGESTCNPFWVDFICKLKEKGVDVALATNGYAINKEDFNKILPLLTYIRFNISAAEENSYCKIHGVSPKVFHKVLDNIRYAVKIKRELDLDVTIGLQMVLIEECIDQVIPLAKLGKEIGADYTVIKHCSDSELGELGVDYDWYLSLEKILKEAETYSDENYTVQAKWSKIFNKGQKSYAQCLAIPFMIQFSGSGLVAPCGFLFNERYKQFHIGNLADTRFKDLFYSDKYWEIIDYLASENFNAHTMCGTNCLQHKVNEFLWDVKTKKIDINSIIVPKDIPLHINFI